MSIDSDELTNPNSGVLNILNPDIRAKFEVWSPYLRTLHKDFEIWGTASLDYLEGLICWRVYKHQDGQDGRSWAAGLISFEITVFQVEVCFRRKHHISMDRTKTYKFDIPGDFPDRFFREVNGYLDKYQAESLCAGHSEE